VTLQVGLFASPFATPELLRMLGPAAEERGFHSLWVAEHVLLFDEYASRYPYAEDGKIPVGGTTGILDPFSSLTFLAAVTDRIRLGTGICLVPQRNPVYTAKEAATLDFLSGGRFDFGIGIGWLREEFEALGVSWPRRAQRTRECIELMRRLWEDDVSEYHGEFYDLPPARQFPKPVQKPHPPLHFGGESDAALRRVAEMGQGWYGFSLAPEALPERLAKLDALLAERGRTRDEIEISICPYTLPISGDAAKRYEDAGVDQLILITFAGRDRLLATLDELAGMYVVPAAAT
jgi:probable F420-dependent oxidoreductase